MSIHRLPLPPKAYRVDLISILESDFETHLAAADEDDLRAKLTKRAAKAHPEMAQAIKRLRRIYTDSGKGASLASARNTRWFRIIMTGWVWHLIAAWGAQLSTVTLIPRTWVIPVGQLSSVDPKKLIEQLRRQLQRCGSSLADGFIFGFLHGEFEPSARCYHLHFHGIVAGEMRAVVKRLKQCRNFRRRYDEVGGRQIKGVRLSGEGLSNLPTPLTYLFQSYWPQRWRGKSVEGKPTRGKRTRIPEPYHTEVLLWLHRWMPADLNLMMKLRVTPNGFVVSSR